jgi:hypothetical protein
MESALKLIPAKHLLMPVEGAGHDLGFTGKIRREDLLPEVIITFQQFV